MITKADKKYIEFIKEQDANTVLMSIGNLLARITLVTTDGKVRPIKNTSKEQCYDTLYLLKMLFGLDVNSVLRYL